FERPYGAAVLGASEPAARNAEAESFVRAFAAHGRVPGRKKFESRRFPRQAGAGRAVTHREENLPRLGPHPVRFSLYEKTARSGFSVRNGAPRRGLSGLCGCARRHAGAIAPRRAPEIAGGALERQRALFFYGPAPRAAHRRRRSDPRRGLDQEYGPSVFSRDDRGAGAAFGRIQSALAPARRRR